MFIFVIKFSLANYKDHVNGNTYTQFAKKSIYLRVQRNTERNRIELNWICTKVNTVKIRGICNCNKFRPNVIVTDYEKSVFVLLFFSSIFEIIKTKDLRHELWYYNPSRYKYYDFIYLFINYNTITNYILIIYFLFIYLFSLFIYGKFNTTRTSLILEYWLGNCHIVFNII